MIAVGAVGATALFGPGGKPISGVVVALGTVIAADGRIVKQPKNTHPGEREQNPEDPHL